MSDVKRSRSMAQLALRDSPHCYTLKRQYSSPELHSGKDLPYVSWKYRPSTFRRYYRDYDLFDEFYWDRRHHTSPLFWPARYLPNRRYNYSDPAYGLWWYYPALTGYPRHGRMLDQLEPVLHRRSQDAYASRPLWNPTRPWLYETVEPRRSVQMYKQGLVDFNTVQKQWLAPYSWERRLAQEHRQPPAAWITSPRRYFMSYDSP